MHSRARIGLIALGFAMLLAFPIPALAENTPAPTLSPNAPASGDLIERPKTWDGQVIPFRGEAIGEAMVRGSYAWLHVNDDAYYVKNVEEGAALGGYNSGMAIWLPANLAREIGTFGDYKHEGDIVEVRGTFNAACAEHGGDMDIHADALTLIREGHPALDLIRPWKAGLAALLAAAAAGLYWLERATRRRVVPHRGV